MPSIHWTCRKVSRSFLFSTARISSAIWGGQPSMRRVPLRASASRGTRSAFLLKVFGDGNQGHGPPAQDRLPHARRVERAGAGTDQGVAGGEALRTDPGEECRLAEVRLSRRPALRQRLAPPRPLSSPQSQKTSG